MNISYQVTLFQWKKVIIVAERKHQCVGSKKFCVETQLQKKPMIIFTNTIVNPEEKNENGNSILNFNKMLISGLVNLKINTNNIIVYFMEVC